MSVQNFRAIRPIVFEIFNLDQSGGPTSIHTKMPKEKLKTEEKLILFHGTRAVSSPHPQFRHKRT